MYWLLTLRCISKDGSEVWCHAITDCTPIAYLKEMEDYEGESYYLVNSVQISEDDARYYDGELHTM
jgi:hypothetical protein